MDLLQEIVAAIVGLLAPVMGTYLVQRRLTLLGDGIGHMALTGVAMGWLAGSWFEGIGREQLAVPGAVIASVAGALIIEYLRGKGKASGDVALALLFYGGIAGGVLLIGVAGGTTANLNGYLFGSISTVTTSDLWLTIALAVVVFAVGLGLRPALFALCHDEEFARSSGIPVRLLSVLISVTAALTVAVSMRVVGVLLVSALMIVPVATSQLITQSFSATMSIAMVIGLVVAEAGLIITYFQLWSPGATIVMIAVGVYAMVSVIRPLLVRSTETHDPHPDMGLDVVIDDPTKGEDCQTHKEHPPAVPPAPAPRSATP